MMRVTRVANKNVRLASARVDRRRGKTPKSGAGWGKSVIRKVLGSDLYRAHSYSEIAPLLTEEAREKLDSEGHYGIFWYEGTEVLREDEEDGQRKTYRKVTVPIPTIDPREIVSRELVDSARDALKGRMKANSRRQPSRKEDRRVWELSGLFRCGTCGQQIYKTTIRDGRNERTKARPARHYYRYNSRYNTAKMQECSNTRSYPAEFTELLVWDEVARFLSDPDRVREHFEYVMEEKAKSRPENPEAEIRRLGAELEKIGNDRQRATRQYMQAQDLIPVEEFRSTLSDLDARRRAAEERIGDLRSTRDDLQKLCEDMDVLLWQFGEGILPTSEGELPLTPEERHAIYRRLRLEVVGLPERKVEVRGFVNTGVASAIASILGGGVSEPISSSI